MFWLIARQENDRGKALSACNFSSRLVAAIQQLQPTNPKKEPNFKTQPKKQTLSITRSRQNAQKKLKKAQIDMQYAQKIGITIN